MEFSDSGYRDDLSGQAAEAILAELSKALRGAGKVLVATHVQPDGDAIGSALGLALGLAKTGCDVTVAFETTLPKKYSEFESLADEVAIVHSVDEARAAGPFDWCGMVDTSEPERVGTIEPLFFGEGQRRFAIDHHLHESKDLFQPHLVVSSAASTASLVLEFLKTLEIDIDSRVARLLWLGLATDTGWFRFSNTTPRVLADASELLALGRFDPEPFFESVYGQHRAERTKLLGLILSQLKVSDGKDFAWGIVTRDMLKSFGVDRSELEGVIDHLKSTAGVAAVALISEIGDDRYKISLRAIGDTDVETIARSIGGGGHKKAAGCSFSGSLEALEARLLEELSRAKA